MVFRGHLGEQRSLEILENINHCIFSENSYTFSINLLSKSPASMYRGSDRRSSRPAMGSVHYDRVLLEY